MLERYHLSWVKDRPDVGQPAWPGRAVWLASLLFLAAVLGINPVVAPPSLQLAELSPALRSLPGAGAFRAGADAATARPEAAEFTAAPEVPDALRLASRIEARSSVRGEASGATTGPAGRWRNEGIIFVTAGQEWNDAGVAAVDQALSMLPARVRTRLGNAALGPLLIQVNRAGRTLSGLQPYGGAANFYSTNEGRNDLLLYPGQSLLTILHEFGHAYNLRAVPAASYARVLLDPEMQSFMAVSGWRVLTPEEQLRETADQTQVAYRYDGPAIWPKLSRLDPLEDFANSFALYFADPASLRQLSAARFEWFERNVGR